MTRKAIRWYQVEVRGHNRTEYLDWIVIQVRSRDIVVTLSVLFVNLIPFCVGTTGERLSLNIQCKWRIMGQQGTCFYIYFWYFINSFVRPPVVCSLAHHLFVHPSVDKPAHSSIRSFVYSFIRPFTPSIDYTTMYVVNTCIYICPYSTVNIHMEMAMRGLKNCLYNSYRQILFMCLWWTINNLTRNVGQDPGMNLQCRELVALLNHTEKRVLSKLSRRNTNCSR